MTLNLPFSFNDLRLEVGLGLPMNCAVDIPGVTLNDCSSGGDNSLPIVFTTWDTYDHAAVPAAPSNFAEHPGGAATQAENAQQDTHIWFTMDPLICAPDFDLLESTTGAGGAYTEVAAGITTGYAHSIGSPEVERHYKLRGNSSTGDDGVLTAALAAKTAPQKPLGLGESDDGDCAGHTITVTWNNGSGGGVRSSKVRWRVEKNSDGFGGYTVTALGATSLQYEAGAVVDSDTFSFELHYEEESALITSDITNTAICFD